ncbi:glycine betaine ABC transporter substrate-binding protein [Litorihabitans aurantiacus]|uniref:Glycine/betaine ABC transporter substrate-binding protein n=1 Tax=Litorihabitans aurantiacus TaxID=1930061 RepID=A0AA37UPA6_9MICO|nr:glycine betaine ABC transporter substrate-binding protein [Litorihabitans aurantiacus]GMA30638.1 glycine/betaine ABC transporter substrate-binding protein [Litorihabitans aurantiacus]
MRRTTIQTLAASAAAALVLAGCGSNDSAASGATVPEGDEASLSIGVPTGWDEGIAVSYLWQEILESEGYDVELETADIGLIFTSLSGGGYDLLLDAWLPGTHADYVADAGEDIVDLGAWYDNAVLTIAVNEDSPAQSLADLADMADEYGNRLVGIEAGAGLTRITQDEVIPTYGLDGMEYVVSSTPAMLAELSSATESGTNVAVTLWRPHWAYDEFPVRDLEDPEGALGGAESIHSFGASDFTERYPTLATWLGAFELTDEQLFELENMMFNSDEYSDEADAAAAWLEENPDFVDDLKAAAQS